MGIGTGDAWGRQKITFEKEGIVWLLRHNQVTPKGKPTCDFKSPTFSSRKKWSSAHQMFKKDTVTPKFYFQLNCLSSVKATNIFEHIKLKE